MNSKLFRALSSALLSDGFAIRFQVQGRSMFPAIADGEVVHVEPANKIRRGEVVLVESDDGLRVHRVVEATGEDYRTRGDACREHDGPVVHRVLGRVARVISRGRIRAPHTWRTRIRAVLGL